MRNNQSQRQDFGTRGVRRGLSLACGALLLQIVGASAWAQTAPAPNGGSGCTIGVAGDGAVPAPCLTTLVTTDNAFNFNGLELAAAQADDAAYVSLLKLCGLTGSGCSGAQLNLFIQLRELEDNAAELLGFGQSAFSLHLSAQALGFALRWTADEEYSAQSSITNRLASNQFDAVTNRLNAVRFITQTMRFARQGYQDDEQLADADAEQALGGGASADENLPGVGRWSVFASGSYGSGSKAPTTFNDAFDFSGQQFLFGADVRLSAHSVFGIIGSEVSQHANFNSSESIASGNVKGSGGGATVYFEQDWNSAYLNVSVGVQHMTLDTRRLVAYPSNNPQEPSVNTNFFSSTGATSWLGTVGGGYSWYLHAFSATPYANLQYLGTRIGAFTETGSGSDPELALSVNGQSVTSLQSILGLKFNYAWSTRLGVIIPYGYGEYRHEFRDKPQSVSSHYVSSQSVADQFQLPTDNIDPNYWEVGGGVITELPHRFQLYAQYLKVLQLQYYSYYAISGGFRFTF
jgi:uncharacterized protein YhjY with autotransporter beta-barrel domain